ncbi:hypothetical protein CTA1_4063, partial [Colletotrichum tanaceti]
LTEIGRPLSPGRRVVVPRGQAVGLLHARHVSAVLPRDGAVRHAGAGRPGLGAGGAADVRRAHGLLGAQARGRPPRRLGGGGRRGGGSRPPGDPVRARARLPRRGHGPRRQGGLLPGPRGPRVRRLFYVSRRGRRRRRRRRRGGGRGPRGGGQADDGRRRPHRAHVLVQQEGLRAGPDLAGVPRQAGLSRRARGQQRLHRRRRTPALGRAHHLWRQDRQPTRSQGVFGDRGEGQCKDSLATSANEKSDKDIYRNGIRGNSGTSGHRSKVKNICIRP